MSLRFRNLKILLTAGLLLTTSSVLLAEDSWKSFRGDAGSGESSDVLPPGDGPLTFEIAWKKPLGSGYSGISIAAGKVVTAFTDGELDLVVALDASTGEEMWRHELGPIYNGHDGSHAGPIATPAIADGRVFALDPAGKLVALDLESGEDLWSVHLTEDLESESPYYGYASSPVVIGDTMVLLTKGEAGIVAGFDASTGDLRWRAVEDDVEASSPIVAVVAGRQQILALGATKIAGVDPSDGTVLWEYEHNSEGGPMGAMTQSPVPLGGSRIFMKYDDPNAAVLELSEVDGALGAFEHAKSKGLYRSYSPVTVSGDHVYGFTSRFLSAVDPASGELLWRSRDVGDGFLISIGGQLAIIQKTGSLHLGAASSKGWTETARVDLFDDLAWTPPSYADGSIYVRSVGEIARVDLVRAPEMVASTDSADLPAALTPLTASLASATDAASAVDEFLEGRSLPIIDGESVVFVWRGDAEDVAVAGDMIGMRREEPMNRLEGTDLWWWETQLDPHARISYLFYPDLQPTVDPSHDRVVTATILGPDMNWKRDEPVQMSWFAMPEWPGLSAEKNEPQAKGRVETVELTVQPSAPEGEEAPDAIPFPAHVWLPPGYEDGDTSYPVIYVINAEARDEGDWPATLDRVVGDSVEPLIVVFPDLPRAPGLRGSLAGQVVPQVDERFRTRTDRESRAVVGMGFPGYTAALVGFHGSDTFGAIGIQSIFFLEGGMKEGIRGAVGEKDPESTPMRIYLEWGRWDLISPHEEMDFRSSSKWAWGFLKEKGYQPIGGEVWDSTDFASWRNRTGLLLQALFPKEDAQDGLSRWQTESP